MSKKPGGTIRNYFIEFGSAMLGYTITVISVSALQPEGGAYQGNLRFLWLLPIIPLLAGFWAIIRQYRRMDEFYQRIHAEAFALGALTWGLITMAWGFAENAGAPVISTIFIAPALIALWGLSLPIVMRRYK